MNKNNLKQIIQPSVSLFLICFFSAVFLALTHFVCKDRINTQNSQKKISSCKTVLPNANDFIEKSSDGVNYYIGRDNSQNIVGYAIVSTAKGYGGKVELITGIDSKGTISGIVILNQSETPGLGANCTREDFLKQYIFKPLKAKFTVVKSDPKENEIQAITGATITSKAVTQAVNDSVAFYNKIKTSNIA